ncbi:hypothetical protein ISS03_02810 [Patescibacteria group bacterium]|nr:hypothetical protein [Patescibacteria group bacterium]
MEEKEDERLKQDQENLMRKEAKKDEEQRLEQLRERFNTIIELLSNPHKQFPAKDLLDPKILSHYATVNDNMDEISLKDGLKLFHRTFARQKTELNPNLMTRYMAKIMGEGGYKVSTNTTLLNTVGILNTGDEQLLTEFLELPDEIKAKLGVDAVNRDIDKNTHEHYFNDIVATPDELKSFLKRLPNLPHYSQ